MGFTKIQKAMSKEKKKPFKDGEQLELKFTPSTKKEIKEYARKAAEVDEAKRRAKITRPERVKLDLEMNLPFNFKRPNALRRVFKECIEERRALYLKDKTKDPRWAPRFPRYEMFEPQKIADSNFVFDVQSCISGFSWVHLTRLINAAAGTKIRTKDATEAFHLFQNIMHQALGVKLDSSGARYRLADRDEVLDKWNVKIVKRKIKMPKKDEEEKVKKVRAAAKEKKKKVEDEDEEDEDEVVNEEEEDENDEDEDADEAEDEVEEDEDEDEEEDEKPKKKKAKVKPAPIKKKKKKVVEEDDEEEDDESEDDDEEEDDEEESDDDEDEEEDEDDDEDGDDTPKSKGKKVAKKVKKGAKEEKEKPGKKKPAKEKSSRNPDAVFKVKKRFTSGGVREQCQNVIPAKGATVEAIGAAMKKKFDIDPKKARSYVSWLTANGFLTRIDD